MADGGKYKQCRVCKREQSTKYMRGWREKNSDRLAEEARARRAADPEKYRAGTGPLCGRVRRSSGKESVLGRGPSAATTSRGRSVNPCPFATPVDLHAGGLIDDCDVTLKELRFVLWDYDGKADADVPALRVTMENEDGEDTVQ